MSCRYYIKVRLALWNKSAAFDILDEDGEQLDMGIVVGRVTETHHRMSIAESRSPVITLPASARTLVLYLGAVEESRTPLRLRAGEVLELEL